MGLPPRLPSVPNDTTRKEDRMSSYTESFIHWTLEKHALLQGYGGILRVNVMQNADIADIAFRHELQTNVSASIQSEGSSEITEIFEPM